MPVELPNSTTTEGRPDMRNSALASVLLIGTLASACSDNPIAMEPATLNPDGATMSVKAGETFSHVRITNPTVKSVSSTVGGARQMAATLYYSAGGTLPGAPYTQWRSMDACVASVTNASPSWGLVRGVKAGTTLIIAETWGKADTVAVTVTGTGNLDPTCADREWSWDYSDVSFTGTPATRYKVAAGEKMTRVVLFAGPKPDYTISAGKSVTLRSELWYSRGGKLNGRGFVTFSVTDGSVASISSTGVVTGRTSGRTKVIARLGTSHADTVPLYVR
jgi:hypothetical protein